MQHGIFISVFNIQIQNYGIIFILVVKIKIERGHHKKRKTFTDLSSIYFHP